MMTYVDATGNLCTNIWEEVDEDIARVFVAYADGQYTTATSITAQTLAADYPTNIATLSAIFTSARFGTLFPSALSGLDYWGFLTAAS